MLTWKVKSGFVGVSRSSGKPYVLLQAELGFESVRLVLTLDEAEALMDDIAGEIRRCRERPRGLVQGQYDAAMSRVLGQVRAIGVRVIVPAGNLVRATS